MSRVVIFGLLYKTGLDLIICDIYCERKGGADTDTAKSVFISKTTKQTFFEVPSSPLNIFRHTEYL